MDFYEEGQLAARAGKERYLSNPYYGEAAVDFDRGWCDGKDLIQADLPSGTVQVHLIKHLASGVIVIYFGTLHYVPNGSWGLLW